MKQIKAVIQPEKSMEILEALDKIGCSRGVMISDIMGQGIQKGMVQSWRGEKFQIELLPKIMLDLVVKDEDLERAKNAILESARTGEIGDGKIFVYDVEEVVRIRTGEEDEDAI